MHLSKGVELEIDVGGDLGVLDVTFDVTGKPSRASLYCPGSQGDWDIKRVMAGDLDMTELISEETSDAINQAIGDWVGDEWYDEQNDMRIGR